MLLTKDEIKLITDKTEALTVEILMKNSAGQVDAEELKAVVKCAMDVKNEERRIHSALDSILEYLKCFGTPLELRDVKNNCAQAFDQFFKLFSEKTELKEQNLFVPLGNAIGITPKTYEQFYLVGCKLYEQNLFEKAADVFFVLAFLSQCHYNVWLSLGLSELKCRNFDAALRAFAMSAVTNADSPEPYLHAADCCIAMSDYHEAELYLEEAMQRIENDPQNNGSFRAYAIKIKKLIK